MEKMNLASYLCREMTWGREDVFVAIIVVIGMVYDICVVEDCTAESGLGLNVGLLL